MHPLIDHVKTTAAPLLSNNNNDSNSNLYITCDNCRFWNHPIKTCFENSGYLESFYPLHLRRICPKVGCHYGHPERLQKHWVLRLNSFPPPV